MSSSTVRAYATALMEALRSYLLKGREVIYNNQNMTLTTKLTSTNTNDNVVDWAKRTVRDAQKRREEDTRVPPDDFTELDRAPEGRYKPGYYKNILEHNYGDWG